MGDVLREVPLFHKGVAPHGVQQFVLGDQPVGVARQEEQDVERLRGEVDRRIGSRQRALPGIQRKLAETVQVTVREARLSILIESPVARATPTAFAVISRSS